MVYGPASKRKEHYRRQGLRKASKTRYSNRAHRLQRYKGTHSGSWILEGGQKPPYEANRSPYTDKNNIVVYVKADLETCKKRDYKGVYKRALKGELKNFTGISDIYEEPQHAEIVIDTEKTSPEIVYRYVKKHYVK